MAGKGSKPGERRGGRQKGVPNKFTANAREAFSFAFNDIGGAPALAAWARENQDEFYKLFARLIPVEHTGEGGGPIKFTGIEITGVAPK